MSLRSSWKFTLFTTSLSFVSQLAHAALPDGRLHGNLMPAPAIPRITVPDRPVTSRNGTTLPPYDTVYYFDQLIDHNNPSLGTFKQRYWHTYEFYEQGGPIIITTPGEGNADGYSGYLTNSTINGLIAQQQNGSTVVIEHRFYGLSNPYPDLTVNSLRLHTIQQAIEDLVYFAQNAHLPMPNGDQVTPDKAPWILIGGSYAGALTSWTMVNKPGIFYAGYSSSGVVEAILDFWGYFEPVRQHMPANCSADVEAVIAHIDQVFTSNDQTAIQAIKDSFGMGDLTHLDDAAGALRNNLWDWQALQVTSGPNTQFYRFCDALEVKDGESASANGWGLDYALSAWSSYFKNTYLSTLCNGASVESCLGTYDTTQPYWTNTDVDNAARSWNWIVCNEVGYLQESPPVGQPSIVSRLIQPIYDLRQCQQMFPQAFSSPPTPNVNRTDDVYRGWDVTVDRLFFANGIRDPWKEATTSAADSPAKSTDSQPIAVGDGFHCSDLGTEAGIVDPTIAAVHSKALASMKTWLSSWKPLDQSSLGPSAPTGASPSVNRREPSHIKPKPVNAWLKGSGTL